MSNNLQAFVVGLLLALLLWVWVLRPLQARDYERERRRLGHKPKRRLPEDDYE